MKGWQYILQFVGLVLLFIFCMATTNGYSPPFNLGDLQTNVTGNYNNGGYFTYNNAPATAATPGMPTIYGQDNAVFGSEFGSNNKTIQLLNPPSHINGFAVTPAVCDGITDDTDAINNIIIADGGGIGGFGAHNKIQPIRLPPGQICNHKRPIEIPYANLDFGGPSGLNAGYANNTGLTQPYIGLSISDSAYAGSISTSIAGPFAGTTAYNPDFGYNIINYDDILNTLNHNLTGIVATTGFHEDIWFYVVSYTASGGGELFGPLSPNWLH